MSRVLAGVCAGLALLVARPDAAEPKPRTISSSEQFIIYCTDGGLRGRVASALEEAKANTLRLLGESDRWKLPIVVTLKKAPALEAAKRPVSLTMLETPQGPTIQLDVQIGDDPGAVHLQKHAVRALLLELTYRDREVRGGEAYVGPPWWLVAGAIESFRRRDTGVDADLFRRLVESNHLPPIEQFLAQHEADPGSAAEAMDGACAMAFLELLLEQPAGRDSLARLARQWPDVHRDPIAALTRNFPGLADGGVQKWWTLNLARFGASDRYQGLSMEETDRELNALLMVELSIDKAGTKQPFHVGEFEAFRKIPSARAALAARRSAMVALSPRVNAVFRPVVNAYERILFDLARGKTRGVREKIVRIEVYRGAVLNRMGEIADHLNWYEATQFGTRSDAFEGFLRAGRVVEQETEKSASAEAIGTYLDELQKQL